MEAEEKEKEKMKAIEYFTEAIEHFETIEDKFPKKEVARTKNRLKRQLEEELAYIDTL